MFVEFVLAVVFLGLSLLFLSKKKNYPPGPNGFPILGNLPQLGREPHKTLLEWKKIYGPIIGIKFGSYDTVTINDTKLIKEAFNSNVFSGRPQLSPALDRSGGESKGILFTQGPHWTEQRRFTVRHLRDFGFGTKSMEAKVQDEIVELIERFSGDVGKPTGLTNRFNAAVVNALWSIMVGQRFKQDDPELLDTVRRLTESIAQNNIFSAISVFVPWVAKVAPKLSGYNGLVKEQIPIVNFIKKQIDRHNETYVQDQPRDFLDVYMDEVKKTKDTSSSFHEKNNVVPYTMTDLFIAGAETTSTTLTWLFAYMVHFPEVQEKMFQEIKKQVGTSRLPSLTDRPDMHYTEAVIHETMRYCTLVPLALFHSAHEDTEFHGFTIPKRTMIMGNIYSVHFDKDIWGDPENFRPERFLDSEGKFKKNENVIPFSTGKRVCPGEGLARDELFLFTTSLFQKFKVCPAKELPDLNGTVNTVVVPKPFQIILENRG